MLTGIQWYAIAIVLAGLLALIAIMAPRRRRLKCAALACTALFLPMSYLAANDLLSRPKPLQIEVARDHLRNAIVTASVLREKQAIYLWLQLPGIAEPRAYQLPWDEQIAIELHKAQREAEVEGTQVQMQLPEAETLDDEEPMFQAISRIPPPPKEQ
jgi:hypothetical protein